MYIEKFKLPMATEKYRFFVSSRMEEFKKERLKIKRELNNFFSIFVYEEDAGARSHNIQETYTEELVNCDLYIGIFGVGYGKYTEDEFRSARAQKIDCLIYEKEKSENEVRDPELDRFLIEISGVENEYGLTSCRFKTIDDLLPKIERDVGRWVKSRDTVLQKTLEKPKLDLTKKYYCDREVQANEFQIADKNEKFNFFILDGAKKQSHTSLVRRFSLDKTARDNVKPPISLQDAVSLTHLQISIQRHLFQKFGISPLPNDLSLNTLVKNIMHEMYQKVFIIFRIEDDLFTKKNILDAIRWFSNEYCDETSLPSGSPDFYFFLIIRYNKTGIWKRRQIRRQLKRFREYIKLVELDSVGPDHIQQWIEEQGIAETETSQELVVNHYFKESSYPMETAEMQLTKLIVDYNTENQELMDLLS